jgi:hypothetical protein
MKRFLLLAAALFIAVGAFAQQPQFGVKAGLNLASQASSEGETGSRAGIHLGLFMEYQIGRMIDFRPELLYSMQGGEYTASGTTYTDKLDYINVPLMFKFYTGQGRRFSIDAGPQLGYMISAKVSGGGDSLDIYDEDGLKKFDASLGVGVSYKLNGGFDIGIRFLAGMTKLYEPVENKNSVVQIGAAYRF